jgi:hypothetical protein
MNKPLCLITTNRKEIVKQTVASLHSDENCTRVPPTACKISANSGMSPEPR